MKIRTKILFLLTLGVLVPLLLSHFFGARIINISMKRLIGDRLVAAAGQVAGRIDDRVQWMIRDLTVAVESIPFESFPADQLSRALEIPYRQLSYSTVIALLDEQGKALTAPYRSDEREAGLLGREPASDRDLEIFANHVPLTLALSGASVALGPVYRSAQGGSRMVAATAFPVAGGAERWVLAVEMSLASVCEHVNAVDQSADSGALLVDAQGASICGPASGDDAAGPAAVAKRVLQATPGEVDDYQSSAGEAVLGTVAEVDVTGWRLQLEHPARLALAPLVESLRWIGLWVVIAALIAIIGGVVLARGLAGPIAELEVAAGRVASGDYEGRLEVRSGDEVGKLAGAFNKMTDEIRAWNTELTDRVEERTRALREAQEQILQTQRLAAVGELGAGVAHEINNPLTGVLGTAQLLKTEIEPGTSADESLDDIISNAKRVAEVVDALLRFSQSQLAADQRPLAPATMLEACVDMFAGRLEEAGIEVVRNYDSECQINGITADLELAFHHLIDNALRAMADGGELRLEVQGVDGGAVQVSVGDSGRGMPQDVVDRAFDPFFTTEPPGSGSKGLGLTLAHRVVTEHNGKIVLDSAPDNGTRATVYFPGMTSVSKS